MPETPKGEALEKVLFRVDGVAQQTRKYEQPVATDDGKPLAHRRTWIIADLQFAPAQQRQLSVSYRVKNRLYDVHFSSEALPSFSERSFRYVLSPSGNWGTGVVSALSISIDVAQSKRSGARIKSVSPKGYQLERDVIRWNYTNVDLKRAADLEVVYDDSARLSSEALITERLEAATVRAVRASSVLENASRDGRHAPAVLLDGKLDSAWCEGSPGPGQGQTVTFELDGARISGIGIVNGYAKSAQTYRGNGRIKRITVLTDDIDDFKGRKQQRKLSVTLPAHEFAELNSRAIAPFIDWLPDFGDGSLATSRLRLTIEDVYPGDQYSDTCVSEVYLLSY